MYACDPAWLEYDELLTTPAQGLKAIVYMSQVFCVYAQVTSLGLTAVHLPDSDYYTYTGLACYVQDVLCVCAGHPSRLEHGVPTIL